ncbi:hypothetical protein PFISCL1PPCAC_25904, partial [Pristionchus fissidentatus]
AQYLFFRTRTDYEHNLIQGSFERATRQAKASIVCEYEAKIVPKQDWYCNKMGSKGLGLNALYDTKKKRCLYTSLTTYTHNRHSKYDTAKFPGCRERPSEDHSVGLDDGMADKEIYDKLTSEGAYRVDAVKIYRGSDNYGTIGGGTVNLPYTQKNVCQI